MAAPKLILYTNHNCPWAHRAHVALKELGLEYEEVIIDLEKPREPWYLEVNPRGLVPSLSYNGSIITESAIVAQFLADAHPSTLLPPSTTPEGALQRARIAFFVDTFFSKVQPSLFSAFRSSTEADREAATEAVVSAIEKEIEPLLASGFEGKGQGPYFNGSEKITLVEVLTGSFLLWTFSFWKPEFGLLSPNLVAQLEQRAPHFKKWAEATIQNESVNYIWDEERVGTKMKARLAAAAQATAKH